MNEAAQELKTFKNPEVFLRWRLIEMIKVFPVIWSTPGWNSYLLYSLYIYLYIIIYIYRAVLVILAGSLPLESRRCVENFSVSVFWAGWRFGTPYAKNWRHFQLLATQFLGFLPPNHGVVRGYKSLPGHFRVSGRSSKKKYVLLKLLS